MGMLNKVKTNKVEADVLNYKYLIAGRPKTGKTTLVYNLMKAKNRPLEELLLVAFERGYSALDGIVAVDIDDWNDFEELVEELIDEKDTHGYKVLAFDTIDIMADLATQEVLRTQSIKKNKKLTDLSELGYGAGYSEVKKLISGMISKLDMAGFTMFFISHDKDKKFETRDGMEYDKTVISLGGGSGELFKNLVDTIAFIEINKEKVKGGTKDTRYIYFRGESGLEAGSRFRHVPEKVEYSAENFVEAMETAILKEYNGDAEAVEKAKEEQNKAKEAEAEKAVEKMKEEKVEEEKEENLDQLLEEYNKTIDKFKEAMPKGTVTAKKKELGARMKEQIGKVKSEEMDYDELTKATAIVNEMIKEQEAE